MQYQNPTGVQERSIPLAIVLTVVTCGIYGLYWIYKLHDETNALCGRRDEMSPALIVLLVIVTCGIFQIYWAYTQGEKFREEAERRGSDDAKDLPILYLVLEVANYFTGVTSIINKALMQDRINQTLRMNGWGNQPYDEGRFTYAPEQDIARKYEQAEAEYNAQANPEARTDIYPEANVAPVNEANAAPANEVPAEPSLIGDGSVSAEASAAADEPIDLTAYEGTDGDTPDLTAEDSSAPAEPAVEAPAEPEPPAEIDDTPAPAEDTPDSEQ